MRNCTDDEAQALNRAAWFSWKADDKRFFNNHRQVSREDCVFGDLHGFDAHDFAEAREFANGDFADRFRSDVTQGHTRAAGSKNELRIFSDLFFDRALDIALFVRHEQLGYYFPAVTFGGLFQS